MNLKQRSDLREILDEPSIPFADIEQNMKELNLINSLLGGHAITVKAFSKLAKNKTEISVCEIGCGGGDNLLAIYKWCNRKGIKLNITGIDIKKECIDFARSRKSFPADVQWITSDYSKVVFTKPPDIIFSSLFCHHFTNDQLGLQLKWMKDNAQLGFFINDLHRNKLAFYSIKLLTKLFSSSYLVKNDAPISVARGFHKSELQNLCRQANVEPVEIEWKWAFRYVLLFRKR